MYLKLNNKKIEIKTCNNFHSRFKSLKFNLEKLDYILYFPKRKFINTYLFCQKVDLCFTDHNNQIIYLYQNLKSEKLIWKKKAENLYIMPLNTVKYLKGEKTLKINK